MLAHVMTAILILTGFLFYHVLRKKYVKASEDHKAVIAYNVR